MPLSVAIRSANAILHEPCWREEEAGVVAEDVEGVVTDVRGRVVADGRDGQSWRRAWSWRRS